jgi:hypothetical protein
MIQVYTASRGDVKDAAKTIVKAFIDDPFNLYFYNLIADPANPPLGTEEMMALHIRNRMITDSVLVVDDGDKRCAGVALWDTPKSTRVGWLNWGFKKLHSLYGSLMGYLYYRNRGINRRVSQLLNELNVSDIGIFGRFKQRLCSGFSGKATKKIHTICIT